MHVTGNTCVNSNIRVLPSLLSPSSFHLSSHLTPHLQLTYYNLLTHDAIVLAFEAEHGEGCSSSNMDGNREHARFWEVAKLEEEAR